MSEDQARYGTQPEAIIDPPRTVRALQDGEIVNYQVWGWVKTSAKFRSHIKILRGAKHDIWHYLALGVDENGQVKETIKEICEGTGYSHTEVINSLRELDELGYLSIQKDHKGNVYTPEFVARGEGKPSESAVKKVESTPVYQVESTPAIEIPPTIPLRVKRVNTAYQSGRQEKPDKVEVILSMLDFPGAKQAAKLDELLNFLGVSFNRNVETKEWKEFAKYILNERVTKNWHPQKFVDWVKSQKGYPEFWSVKRMKEYYPQAFEEASLPAEIKTDENGVPETY